MSKCHFNKVAKQLRHGCSPANWLNIFRTLFPKNKSGRLLLPVLFWFPYCNVHNKCVHV